MVVLIMGALLFSTDFGDSFEPSYGDPYCSLFQDNAPYQEMILSTNWESI